MQKAVAADGGFALVVMSVPTVGKQVFLRVVSTIPTVMRCMTPFSATVKKAACGRSKSPAFAGIKTATYLRPPPQQPEPLPKPSLMGWNSFLLSLRRLCGSPSHLRRLGWGLLVGRGFSLAFSLLFIASVRGMK